MCSISWKFKLINNHRWTIDKGKGSCNGKCGERWYHSFDPSKYKLYEGSLLKINFLGKVYEKVLCNAILGHQKLGIPLTSYCEPELHSHHDMIPFNQ